MSITDHTLLNISPETHAAIARHNAAAMDAIIGVMHKIGFIESGGEKLRAQIPPLIADGLDEYALYGYPVGGFLTAVLENDFIGAVCIADRDSLDSIVPIAKYVYNFMPSACHGSQAKVDAWLARRVKVSK